MLPHDEKLRDRRCVQTGVAISRHFSSQMLLNKDRQCCESWRDAELGVCAVCYGWYDWRRPLSRSAVLFVTLWHCRELSVERYAHHIQFEFWLLRRLTPAITDRPPPVLWRQQSVPSVLSTTQLLRVCCSALAATRQLHLFGDILGLLCYSLLWLTSALLFRDQQWFR